MEYPLHPEPLSFVTAIPWTRDESDPIRDIVDTQNGIRLRFGVNANMITIPAGDFKRMLATPLVVTQWNVLNGFKGKIISEFALVSILNRYGLLLVVSEGIAGDAVFSGPYSGNVLGILRIH